MFNHLRNTVLIVPAAAALAAPWGRAGAPQAGVPNPGFYRMVLGDFEILALSDGTHPFPIDSAMIDTSAESIARGLGAFLLALFAEIPVMFLRSGPDAPTQGSGGVDVRGS